jgi:hypothetical protein
MEGVTKENVIFEGSKNHTKLTYLASFKKTLLLTQNNR